MVAQRPSHRRLLRMKRAVVVALLTLSGISARPAVPEPLLFEKDVYPIFQKRCSGCHFPTAEQLKAKLDLSTAATALAGGKSGPPIIPGSADTSPMILSLLGKRDPVMPPPEKFDELPENEIATIKQWIDNGAKSDGTLPARVSADSPAPAGASARPAAITALACSPASAPGAILFAQGGLRTVRLFSVDATTGAATFLAKLEGHADLVRALAFSPDGAYLAAAGGLAARRGELVLWRVADRYRLWTKEAHKDAILDVAFSPDGTQLATASYDKNITLWNVATGEPTRTLSNHVDAVYAIAFSPDGALLASGGGDRMVKIWDTKSGTLLTTISDSKDAVMSLAFAPNGTRLAAAGADKIIRVWEMGGATRFEQTAVSMGKLLRSTFAHDGAVLHLAYSPDSATLYSTSEDRVIKAWDAEALTEKLIFEPQSDWVSAFALSPDGHILAAGRYDATRTLYAADTGTPLSGENPVPAANTAEAATQKKKVTSLSVAAVMIEATVPPSLAPLNPSRFHRGSEIEMDVDGKNLDRAEPIVTNPVITAAVITNEALPPPVMNLAEIRGTGADIFDNARPHKLKLKLTVPETVAPGYYELMFRTPTGLTNARGFNVVARPDLAEAEPNDAPDQAQTIQWPAVVLGKISQPGDIDRYKFAAKAGQEIVFAITDSDINAAMTLSDGAGRAVAEPAAAARRKVNRLGCRVAADGDYVLEIADKDLRADLGYRLHVGEFPYVTQVWPLGIKAGAPQKLHVAGFNLGVSGGDIEVTPPDTATHETTLPLPIAAPEGSPIAIPSVAVSPYDEIFETEPNDTAEQAQPVAFPCTINARIEPAAGSAEDSDLFRVTAGKGQTILIETMASRLGSPLDSVVDILDSHGVVLQRGIIRCVAETFVTLSNRDSASAGIRLDSWRDLAINDYVMVGSEIIQVEKLPGYGDEDVVFKSYPSGQRMGIFGTTPEHHSVNGKVYKIEIHPPDKTFAPNGMPLFPLLWSNDDGFFGDGAAGGDSLLEFTAPADGDYIIRVRDAMGTGGQRHAYRLMLRPAEPDYDVVMSPYRVNISRSGRTPLDVRVRRKDGFSAPVTVGVQDLPPGFTVEPGVILGDDDSVKLALVAGPNAQSTPIDASFRITAEATLNGQRLSRETRLGSITVSEVPADLIVNNGETRLAIAPGQSGWISVKLSRANGFNSRVPIDVLNLPFGVRILDTGLNGILVREGESDRKMEVYVEPWVQPMTRNIYVQARIETVSAAQPRFLGEPIELNIGPAPAKVAGKPINGRS
jgi:WD40 repeat protein